MIYFSPKHSIHVLLLHSILSILSHIIERTNGGPTS